MPAGAEPGARSIPAEGLIATANSFLPVPQPEWFEGDFDTPFRADRIREALAARADWSVETLGALEGDTRSLWARRLVGRARRRLRGGRRAGARRARRLGLRHGRDAARRRSSPSSSARCSAPTFEDEATRAGDPPLRHPLAAARACSTAGCRRSFWDDVSTPAVEDRAAIVARALGAAWRRRRRALGRATSRALALRRDPAGSRSTTRSARCRSSGRWFNRGPFPVAGSATSVLAFGGPWRGEVQEVAYGPSMRLVTDAADPDRTLVVMPGGQSGHPGDPHYDDQIADYLANRPRPFPWSEAAIEAATVSRLRLVPAIEVAPRRGGRGGGCRRSAQPAAAQRGGALRST